MTAVGNEFEAIKTVHDALEPLEDGARRRILAYISNLFGIDAQPVSSPAEATEGEDNGHTVSEDEATDVRSAKSFSSFADFYAKANAKTNGEKALLAGYWLQVRQGAANFTAAAANKELSHLGHRLPNITDAINRMKGRKPELILQLKKGGTSRQARKLYKVTVEGEKRVEEMVGG